MSESGPIKDVSQIIRCDEVEGSKRQMRATEFFNGKRYTAKDIKIIDGVLLSNAFGFG